MVNRQSSPFGGVLQQVTNQRNMIFGFLITLALLAFELFNFSTTDFALTDLLGDLKFAGIRWSTMLALAFCGIDFAGIARLFSPETAKDETSEIWYLFGAWLLAASMNAILTWWGISIALLYHESLGNAVIDRPTLLKTVPVFIAVMVWLSRIMIIGAFTVAGENLFVSNNKVVIPRTSTRRMTGIRQETTKAPRSIPNGSYSNNYRPAPKPGGSRPRETYTQVPMLAKGHNTFDGDSEQYR